MSLLLLYEKYHKNIKTQKRVISLNNFTYQNILKNISKYIPNSGNVLDIGSATGTISFYFASKKLDVDGIELSKNAVKFANINKKLMSLKNVNFTNSSIENYIPNKKYDLIICLEVLEHIKNDKECLYKISRLMNVNAALIISVPSRNAPLFKLGLLNKFDKKVGHLRRYTILDIESKINLSGLKIVKVFKCEGIFRNILFTNNIFGFLIKFMKFSIINYIFTFFDNLSIPIFGESQIILICKKE